MRKQALGHAHPQVHPIRDPDAGTCPVSTGLCGKGPRHVTGPGSKTQGTSMVQGAEMKGEGWEAWRGLEMGLQVVPHL